MQMIEDDEEKNFHYISDYELKIVTYIVNTEKRKF